MDVGNRAPYGGAVVALNTSVVDADGLLADASRVAELTSLLASSWSHPEAVLRDELKKMSRVLLAFAPSSAPSSAPSDGRDSIVGFISWVHHELEIDGRPASASYIGLGSVVEGAKGQGIGAFVVTRGVALALNEAYRRHLELENASPQSPLVWGTTASPVAYFGLRKAFPSMLPDDALDAPADAQTDAIAAALLDALGTGQRDQRSPFLARSASAARFTEREANRLRGVLDAKASPLFGRLDETEGDRVLMVFTRGEEAVRLRQLSKDSE